MNKISDIGKAQNQLVSQEARKRGARQEAESLTKPGYFGDSAQESVGGGSEPTEAEQGRQDKTIRYQSETVALVVVDTGIKWPKVTALVDSDTPSLCYSDGGESCSVVVEVQFPEYAGWRIWSAVGVRYGIQVTLMRDKPGVRILSEAEKAQRDRDEWAEGLRARNAHFKALEEAS